MILITIAICLSRRWIGYKVGYYLIDEAMKRTGKRLKS